MQKTLSLKDHSLFDLSSGKKILPTGNKYKQEIMPGSGKLLFVGTTENANKLHAMIAK